MTEAWLLFDESAIRVVAGNPNGKNPLNIPDLSVVEQIPFLLERFLEESPFQASQ